MTTFTVLLVKQAAGAVVLAGMLPHAAVKT